MSRGAPAGWYPDPGEPGQKRWWDGSGWSDEVVAPLEPVSQAPDATLVVEEAPVTPAPVAPEAVIPEPVTSAPAPAAGPATRPRPGTVWIWLAIVASVFPFYSPLLVDTVTAARLLGYFVLPAGYDPGQTGWVLAGLVLLAFVVGLALAASLLFAWLDARALRRRGIERPFGWGWAALVFVATLAVYVVGRTVVVRRRTGRGTLPLWAWLVATLLGLGVFALWLASFVDTLWVLVSTTA